MQLRTLTPAVARILVSLAVPALAPPAVAPPTIAQPAATETAAADLSATLARAAASQVGVTTRYDPAYVALDYPNGDLPLERGVCTDVVIRAFRTVGIDLQVEVHEDMRASFAAYPAKWGLRRPDKNIDHRRVPNLMTFFRRQGKAVPLDGDYRTGDIVAWRLASGQGHIGIVAAEPVPGADRHYIIHNIGAGTRREDVLHAFEIIGHYRW